MMRIPSFGSDSPKKRGWAVLLLSLMGLANAGVLTHIHYKTHTDETYQSFCSFTEGFSCDAVAASEYSNFLGLPVAIWGLVGYLLMGTIGLWLARTKTQDETRTASGALFLVASGAMAASALLMTVSILLIDAACPLCTFTHGLNTGIAVFAFFAARRSGGVFAAALEAPKLLVRRPGFVAGFSAPFAASVIALLLSVPTYWKAEIRTFGDQQLCVGITEEGAHWIGAEDPCLTIVEYSDYECGHCRARHSEMRDLVAKNPDKVRLIHCQYPLDQKCNPNVPVPFHKAACDKACMAVCAGEQGAFWEANDFLFQCGRTSTPSVDELAAHLGIDQSDLSSCVESGTTRKTLDKDIAEASRQGVKATPTFLINGRIYTGKVPDKVISEALKSESSGDDHKG